MTLLEIEKLERNVTGSDNVIAAEARSVDALPDLVGEDRRNVLLEMGVEEQADSLDEEEIAIIMEIAEVIENKFKTHGITKTNELFYAGAFVVTNRLGVKLKWKRRLQNKIKELRKDLSQLEASKDEDISNFRHWERFERKYSIRVERLNVAIEDLKQRITAIATKVRRYQGRVDSYRQN